MVVVCPPPSMFTPRSIDYVIVSDDDSSGSSESGYHDVLLKVPGSLLASSSSGDLILEVAEEEEDDDDESHDTNECWDPLQHVDELPLRPMSRLRKACIDVAFVAFTVAAEAGLVRAALDDGLATLLVMLPFMLGFLYLAILMHLVATRDFSTALAGQDRKLLTDNNGEQQ